jgi:thiol-disulfide isomerase/thioredoxin
MALTPSKMVSLGTVAPDFNLTNVVDGKSTSLKDFQGSAVYVMCFICNHCPYVKHIREALAKIAFEYKAKKVAFIGISSNDAQEYPDDSPEKMVEEVHETGYCFPYLYDESQEVAKAYQAACTPDFFVYDSHLKLAYRGQFDDTRPGGKVPATGADLVAAIEAVLKGQPIPENTQKPSMGCNIKWKKD